MRERSSLHLNFFYKKILSKSSGRDGRFIMIDLEIPEVAMLPLI